MVSFKEFRRQRLLGASPLIGGGGSTEADAALMQEAFLLHAAVCEAFLASSEEGCTWEQEEDGFLDPWAFPSHMKWLSLAQTLKAKGLKASSVVEAVENALQEAESPLF